MLLPTVHRCSVPLFFCPPNFGRSSSSSPQSLSQSTFHRDASKGHNICSRKVCSAVFSLVFFCFCEKRPAFSDSLWQFCDDLCAFLFTSATSIFSRKKGKPCFNEFFFYIQRLKKFSSQESAGAGKCQDSTCCCHAFLLSSF